MSEYIETLDEATRHHEVAETLRLERAEAERAAMALPEGTLAADIAWARVGGLTAAIQAELAEWGRLLAIAEELRDPLGLRAEGA